MEEVTTWRRAAGRRAAGDRKPASVPRTRLARQVSIESDAGMPRRTDAGWQLSQGSEHSDAFITDHSLRSVSLRDTASAATADIEPPPRGTTRRVLVASGDPRPGATSSGSKQPRSGGRCYPPGWKFGRSPVSTWPSYRSIWTPCAQRRLPCRGALPTATHVQLQRRSVRKG
jgi:hypothetical protein